MKDRLPAFVIAELFRNTLVDTGEQTKQKFIKEESSKAKKIYLGNYERKIIVLVNDTENVHLNDKDLEFLTGILNACKLNLAQIALINFNKNAVDFAQLKKEMQPEYLLLFGVNALQIDLPFTMPHYQVQQYDNCKIVTAPALAEINQASQQAKAEKTKLWKSLKNMFVLEK
jgi:hypothetical protein